MRRNHRTEAGYSLPEMLTVVAIIGILGAIAIPMTGNAVANFRLTGDVRSVANAVAVAKMRAASAFSRTRLYVDLTTKSYRVETWSKASTTCCWVAEGGWTPLSTGVNFSFGLVGTPPPNTQGLIDQALDCTDDMGTVIMNTACIMFNSRGVPVDSTFAPTSADALYLTDGTAVYAVTVAPTGMARTWRTPPTATPTWVRQ